MNETGETLTPADFQNLFGRFQRRAFRLEVQRQYIVDWEAGPYAEFLAGNGSRALADHPAYQGWLNQIRRAAATGRAVERVRIVDEPPTDYQRWEMDASRWNIEAGESIRIATRAAAAGAGLPMAYDWWLFDDDALAWMKFGPNGEALGGHIVTDPETLLTHCAWRDLAVRISTPASRGDAT